MTLKQLLDILDEHGIAYAVNGTLNDSEEHHFQLASLKKIIPWGIYYFVGDTGIPSEQFNNSIVLVNNSFSFDGVISINVDDPQMVHYMLSNYFGEKESVEIHPTAIISPDAIIGKNVSIGAYSVIGRAIIGDDVVIRHHVVVESSVEIRSGTLIDSNSVIGAAGYAWVWGNNGKRIRQRQLGGVIIGEDCCIGTDVTIVRGSLSENTLIGEGTIISHGSKIGHGCQVGKNVHFANNVSLAGNAVIGERSFLGSACVISSNVSVGVGTIVGAGAVVTRDCKEEYVTLAGIPASIIKRNNFEGKPKGVPKPIK